MILEATDVTLEFEDPFLQCHLLEFLLTVGGHLCRHLNDDTIIFCVAAEGEDDDNAPGVALQMRGSSRVLILRDRMFIMDNHFFFLNLRVFIKE